MGCRTNQQEIAALGDRLACDGISPVAGIEDADVVIVNTCAVTGATEARTRRLIRSIARIFPRVRILVTGCMAQQTPRQLIEYEGVCCVVGNAHKDAIPGILKRSTSGIVHSEFGDSEVPPQLAQGVARIRSPREHFGRTRLPLKVQEGCDHRCSYCIVPLLRGPSRSVPLDRVTAACEQAVTAGYKEIVLSGTHIGQYRNGMAGGLTGLVERLLHIEGDFRVRLSSLDPRDLTDDVLGLVAEEPRVCDHLHVSVQSLCPGVLSAMQRHCRDLDLLVSRLESLRASLPHVCLGGDFIVGHPGESERMFRETLENVSGIGFCYGHVFRFSGRPGTAARAVSGQVGEQDKRERSTELRNELQRLRTQFARSQLGREHRIIVEKTRPVFGVTSNYLRMVVADGSARYNEWVDVAPERYDSARNRCYATTACETVASPC